MERWPTDHESVEHVRRHWTRIWGDRRQELVFIGEPDMDEPKIRAGLDASLHGSPATGIVRVHAWVDDPFPVWGASA